MQPDLKDVEGGPAEMGGDLHLCTLYMRVLSIIIIVALNSWSDNSNIPAISECGQREKKDGNSKKEEKINARD